MRGFISLIATASVAMAASAHAAGTPAELGVIVGGIDAKGRIAPMFAFCTAAAAGHTQNGGNVSPEVQWFQAPKGTQSFAIIMHDPDVPTSFDDANKPGRSISADLPRRDFFHWVLVDIAPHTDRLPVGADSDHVDKNGKHVQRTRYGIRGINSYGPTHFGYDGPCPPWNDTLEHHYIFTVYALDVRSLGLSGAFDAEAAQKAMEGHVLAQGSASGTYTQNPALLQ